MLLKNLLNYIETLTKLISFLPRLVVSAMLEFFGELLTSRIGVQEEYRRLCDDCMSWKEESKERVLVWNKLINGKLLQLATTNSCSFQYVFSFVFKTQRRTEVQTLSVCNSFLLLIGNFQRQRGTNWKTVPKWMSNLKLWQILNWEKTAVCSRLYCACGNLNVSTTITNVVLNANSSNLHICIALFISGLMKFMRADGKFWQS